MAPRVRARSGRACRTLIYDGGFEGQATVRIGQAVTDSARTATTVAVATMLTFGVVGALTVDPDRGTQQVRTAASPSTTAIDEDPVDTTTTTVAPTAPTGSTATATAVAVPPKPKASTAPRSSSAGTGSALGPKPPGSAVFAFQAGRTSWSATSNGVTMSLTIDKATPRAGEPVTFTVSGSMPNRPCCDLSLVYGDGGTTKSDTGYCSYGNSRPTATGTTRAMSHAYNKAGRWEFALNASSTTCGDNMAYGSLYGWIEVAAGVATSQGPTPPAITVGRYAPAPHSDDPSYATVYAQAWDDDGYIARLVVDYGDGATQEFPGDGMGCRPTSGGWPAASRAWLPSNPPPTHQYSAPGTYKVTVTAFSQGCDGRDVQTASGSFDHVY